MTPAEILRRRLENQALARTAFRSPSSSRPRTSTTAARGTSHLRRGGSAFCRGARYAIAIGVESRLDLTRTVTYHSTNNLFDRRKPTFF